MITRAFPTLLVTSLKGYTRNRSAMFFSLLVPLMIMVIFGLLNLGGSQKLTIGVVDRAGTDASRSFISALEGSKVFDIKRGALDGETSALRKGDRAVVLALPEGFGATGAAGSITMYKSSARPTDALIAGSIIQQFLFRAARTQPPVTLDTQEVNGKDVTYVDFLVPGIMALSIMQTGIFSVGFALVAMKKTGILRRLMATPMHVMDFMAAQVGTRMIMAAAQVAILLAVALGFFHFHLAGNVLSLMLVAILGSGIFIAIGFAIAGYAKSEDAVPALANIVVLPMMFLSGVFFGRSGMPDWLHTISDFLPLTYLTDAIRNIAVEGTSLWGVRGQLLGILAWLVISVFLATRLFRWEVS
jgi:ABC-2 type transport system permease protein